MVQDQNNGAKEELNGCTALVTGSSKNIGRAIAVRLGEEEVNVGVTARNDLEGCKKTADEIRKRGGNAVVVTGDLTKPNDVEGIINTVNDEFGNIDILVNNASIRPKKEFLDIQKEEIDNVFNVNFYAPFLLSQQVIPQMIESQNGSIINILGLMAIQGRKFKSHTVASRTALSGLTRSLASEFGPDGIRVNCVVPGRKIQNTGHDTTNESWKRDVERIVDATPLRRRATPREIANLCLFLASGQSSFITGQTIHADGGLFPVYDIQEDIY